MSVAQIVVGAICLPLILLASWRSLPNPRSHGFYRFFGFMATLGIIVLNLPRWLGPPYDALRVLSWVFLTVSGVYVVWSFSLFRRLGGHAERPESPETLAFEETERLVTTGLYRFIRHPMYGSLLFLAWGGCLKHVTPLSSSLVAVATIALVITAKIEERENLGDFGEAYAAYMQDSRMFVPFLF
ncbi:methyltransferase family protein [Gemmatimonadota bacterium]